MTTDGTSGRDRLLSRSGLAVLLENEAAKDSLVTSASCNIEEAGKSMLERTLVYLLDGSVERLVGNGCKIDYASYLEGRLKSLEEPADASSKQPDGAVVNGDVITIDQSSVCGNIKFIHGVIESQTIFSSARANAYVWKGKWMYEVTLCTAGIQQLGWATASCPFTDSEGVGDAVDSYAYDGRRIRKWSVGYEDYGQPWVVGDVIGCCLDLDAGQITFHRNGISLGVAYNQVRKLDGKEGYFPAVSLSQTERCELNFGGRPLKYPVKGFLPLQSPPSEVEHHGVKLLHPIAKVKYLCGCLQRLVQLDSPEFLAAMTPEESLKRLSPLAKDDVLSLGGEICKLLAEFLSTGDEDKTCGRTLDYIVWGTLIPFLLETYRLKAPHDGPSVDRALDLLLPALDTCSAEHCLVGVLEGLAHACRTAPFNLSNCPYSGSYPFLALACHLLRRYEVTLVWFRSRSFENCLEGLLSKKAPNKHDLQTLIPVVWWPGSRIDTLRSEANMKQTISALSRTIDKIEDLHFQLCNLLLNFLPPASVDTEIPGTVLRSFLDNLVQRNRGANRNMPPPGLSDNSVLVSVYTVLLRLLSEGMGMVADYTNFQEPPFLHKGGKRKFPVDLFLNPDACLNEFSRLGGTYSYLVKTSGSALQPEDHAEVEWEEGDMDTAENCVTHETDRKPCCCSSKLLAVSNFKDTRPPVTNQVNCNVTNDPMEGTSGRGEAETYFKSVKELSTLVREEELLDKLMLLYHLAVSQNFKQASYHMQHQVQLIAQVEDADRQIRCENTAPEQLKRIKEARSIYREELIEYVRQSTWYRVCLVSNWKQRGMFATCMWVAQLLLVLSKRDNAFVFVPEFYVETLVDSFHALRRSEPPYVAPSMLLQEGLCSLVTFLVTHFHDTRIVNADLRDFLLQSISVLVQYKEHLSAFECNKVAEDVMAGALLSMFDNRFWIPVSNILLRLCKGAGFGASRSILNGESSSPFFQSLVRKRCKEDQILFAAFLNRLFNTLNWTISEFSVSMKEIQEFTDHRQVPEFQQRKCSIMFELSCNLERILEFFAKELPDAFLLGPEMNLHRLCELIMFILSRTTTGAAAEHFDSIVKRQGQSLEKINRALILAPIVGIVLELAARTAYDHHGMDHDIARALASVDVSGVAMDHFKSLLDYDWVGTFRGDPSLNRLPELKVFLNKLRIESDDAKRRAAKEMIEAQTDKEESLGASESSDGEGGTEICSICYACEMNAMFLPCKHTSCLRCVSRHLLNNQRCFFCNTTIAEVCPFDPCFPITDSKALDS